MEIDRDNFNDVMESFGPRIAFQVENKLSEEGGKMNVELKFKQMDDFDPVAVLKQVKPLAKLYEARQRLADLLTKLDGNDELDHLLQDVVNNTEQLTQLKDLAGSDEEEEGGEEKAEGEE